MNDEQEIGFIWWQFTGWSGFVSYTFIVISGLYSFDIDLPIPKELAEMLLNMYASMLWFFALNIIVSIFIIRYNKYAFLVGTIISFNPIVWMINGIYLQNRWHHSRVNKTSKS